LQVGVLVRNVLSHFLPYDHIKKSWFWIPRCRISANELSGRISAVRKLNGFRREFDANRWAEGTQDSSKPPGATP